MSGDGSQNLKFEASSLEDIANAFDEFASDQRVSIGRFVKTQKGKRECEIRAEVWADAARIIRNTTILPDMNAAVKDGDGI